MFYFERNENLKTNASIFGQIQAGSGTKLSGSAQESLKTIKIVSWLKKKRLTAVKKFLDLINPAKSHRLTCWNKLPIKENIISSLSNMPPTPFCQFKK